jgi:hypothetical protein
MKSPKDALIRIGIVLILCLVTAKFCYWVLEAKETEIEFQEDQMSTARSSVNDSPLPAEVKGE